MSNKRICAYSGCGKPFVLARADQQVCDNRCRAAKWRADNQPRCPHCQRAISIVIRRVNA